MAYGLSEITQNGVDYRINDPNIANEFSASTVYSAGTYVNYNGILYRFTVDHPAGAWNSSHVSAVEVGNEIADLKITFLLNQSGKELKSYIDQLGSIYYDTGAEANSETIKGAYSRTSFIPVLKDDILNYSGLYALTSHSPVAIYDRNRVYQKTDSKSGLGSSSPLNGRLVMPYDGYVRFVCRTTYIQDSSIVINRHVATDQDITDATSATGTKLTRVLSLSTTQNVIQINENEDIDNLEVGNYKIPTVAIASTIDSLPVSSPGRLFVYTTTITSYKQQIYVTSTEGVRVFRRHYNGSSWLRWNETANVDAVNEIEAIVNLLSIAPETRSELYLVSGNITNGGTPSVSNTRIRTADLIEVKRGMFLNVSEPYKIGIAIFTDDSGFTATNFEKYIGGSSLWYNGLFRIPDEYIGKYIGIRISITGKEEENISSYVEEATNLICLYDESTILTSSNYSNNLSSFIFQNLPEYRASAFDWEINKTISTSGDMNESTYAAFTGLIPVDGRTTFINNTQEIYPNGSSEIWMYVFVAEYKDDVFIRRRRLYNGRAYTTPEDIDGVRLVATYVTGHGKKLYSQDLIDNFSIKFMQNPMSGDGQKPVYAAFGASTTVGAVHHYDGINVTYSPYAYPNYIGQILGLATHNLGYGTTGFMARNDGKSPNIMDAIYENSEILSNTDLITITFGYGNDKSAGLAVGEWDDYFNYDEVGDFYVSGNTEANLSGITDMLSKGATLFGCLNWCIKWIGEHYPKAMLICICGAPSGNNNRDTTINVNPSASAGTTGVSPFKIATQSPDATSSLSVNFNTLKEKINIPMINLFDDTLPFSYYSTYAKKDGVYSVFSTKGTVENPVWNSHPNESGYLMYARYLAGRISQYFRH